MRKFAFGIWKFEFRNSKFEIPQPVKGKEGFTLIEIILVLVIIGVLAGILIEPFRLGVKSYIGIETRADLTSQARAATNRVVREMRNIQKKANDKPNITSADATSITFVDNQGITISFSLSGSTVLRDTNILADKVSSLQFRYFAGKDANYAELTPPLSTPPLPPASDADPRHRISDPPPTSCRDSVSAGGGPGAFCAEVKRSRKCPDTPRCCRGNEPRTCSSRPRAMKRRAPQALHPSSIPRPWPSQELASQPAETVAPQPRRRWRAGPPAAWPSSA